MLQYAEISNTAAAYVVANLYFHTRLGIYCSTAALQHTTTQHQDEERLITEVTAYPAAVA
jgi:hypothetical protein